MTNRTCNNCGWVAFGVSREFAETEVARFNKFYNESPPETKECYGGPSSIAHYECCSRCGNGLTEFHDSEPGDCPDGCTLSPIIVEAARVANRTRRERLDRQETQALVDRYLNIPEYPAPAVTGYEVTPASGVQLVS